MSSLKYIGNQERQSVTLGAAYTAASGTMTLTSGHGARLPSAGDFWLVTRVGVYRSFKVTARSTDILTVVAAQDGTADASLDINTELNWSLTASALDQLKLDIVMPLSVYTVPVLANLTLENGGNLYDDGSYLTLAVPQTAAEAQRIASHGYTAPKKCTVAMISNMPGSNYGQFGIGFRQSSTGKLTTFGRGNNSQGRLDITDYTNPSTWSASPYGIWALVFGPVTWFQIEDDNTNLYFRVSVDGKYWRLVYQRARGSFMTGGPDQFVIVAASSSNEAIGYAHLLSYKEE